MGVARQSRDIFRLSTPHPRPTRVDPKDVPTYLAEPDLGEILNFKKVNKYKTFDIVYEKNSKN
jgi:hypothetical protein